MQIGEYSKCLKCKELTAHASGKCKLCRTSKCRACDKEFSYNRINQSVTHCAYCAKLKRQREARHQWF